MELVFNIFLWIVGILILSFLAILFGCALYSLLIFVFLSLNNEYRGKPRPRNLEEIIYDPNKKRPVEEPLKQIKTFHWIGYCASIVIMYLGFIAYFFDLIDFVGIVIASFFVLGSVFFLGGFISDKLKIKRKPTTPQT